MASMTIADLPSSQALDYKAMSAIRGSGSGDWVLYAFAPYKPATVPLVNFYQTNYFANNLTLQNENIAVNAIQNALTANVSVLPKP